LCRGRCWVSPGRHTSCRDSNGAGMGCKPGRENEGILSQDAWGGGDRAATAGFRRGASGRREADCSWELGLSWVWRGVKRGEETVAQGWLERTRARCISGEWKGRG
jgi:hypothetical protein